MMSCKLDLRSEEWRDTGPPQRVNMETVVTGQHTEEESDRGAERETGREREREGEIGTEPTH